MGAVGAEAEAAALRDVSAAAALLDRQLAFLEKQVRHHLVVALYTT